MDYDHETFSGHASLTEQHVYQKS
uniref:Uncharacterized protein n=1 Tax=Arundo donax TaxID=35708 RepID=A0A0A8Z453_ARUDO